MRRTLEAVLTISVTALSLIGLAAILSESRSATILPTVYAQGSRNEAVCTNANLRGTFGAGASGFLPNVPGYSTTTETTPFAEVGTTHYDGIGNFSGSATLNVGGAIVPFSASGTYTVNSDCTVSFTGTGNDGTTSHSIGVLVEHGNRLIVLGGADPNSPIWFGTSFKE